MVPDPILERIATAYPRARPRGVIEHWLPKAVVLDEGVVRGDSRSASSSSAHASPQGASGAPVWVALAHGGEPSERRVEVKWLASRGHFQFVGPSEFVRSDGGTVDDDAYRFGRASLDSLRQRPVLFEDKSAWVLAVALDPVTEHVTTVWFDTVPLGPGANVPPPPFDAWREAGGASAVIDWARSRLAEDEGMGIDGSWSRLVTGGALLRLRAPDPDEARELERALQERRLPTSHPADAVVRAWREQVDTATAAHYWHVAIVRAHGVADELESVASEADPFAAETLARLAHAIERREDVASVIAAIAAGRRDPSEIAAADARALAAADELPLVSVARASARLVRAAMWDVEGWWLGNVDEEDGDDEDLG